MNPRRQIFTGLALLAVVVVVGTFGYVIIEGVSPFDAFYMVAITVSTVGFREEFALSTTGQVWTILIIVMGLGLVLYTAVASIEYLIDLDAVRRRRKMNNDIARLSNHVIVCGWGRVGRGTWNVLSAREVPVVVIEADGDRAEAARSSGALTIHGDATHNDVLELAGVDSAQSAIACVADDSDNLVIALSVKALRPELRVICRATELESERKLRLAGADAVVAPQAVGAERLAMMALQPELARSGHGHGRPPRSLLLQAISRRRGTPSPPVCGNRLRLPGASPRPAGTNGVFRTQFRTSRPRSSGDRATVS